jgi:peptide-methionine (S)-S-oxide reductase
MNTTLSNKQTTTFGGGCFWCTEAIFKNINGVISVMSGYTGGIMPHPTYEQVCTGTTGHVEAVQIIFDPNVISFAQLLNIFFATHDPTSMDRQGNDIGSEYRSVVFYHNELQHVETEKFIKSLTDEKIFHHRIVTEIKPTAEFFPAEEYHRDYMAKNPNQPYCQVVINPKISKLRENFHTLIIE